MIGHLQKPLAWYVFSTKHILQKWEHLIRTFGSTKRDDQHRIISGRNHITVGVRWILWPLCAFAQLAFLVIDPDGTRTRVTGVKGRCPRPLDDGAWPALQSNAAQRATNHTNRKGL